MGDNQALMKRVDQLIEDNNVMVFSKSYCPYCKMAKEALTSKLVYQYITWFSRR